MSTSTAVHHLTRVRGEKKTREDLAGPSVFRSPASKVNHFQWVTWTPPQKRPKSEKATRMAESHKAETELDIRTQQISGTEAVGQSMAKTYGTMISAPGIEVVYPKAWFNEGGGPHLFIVGVGFDCGQISFRESSVRPPPPEPQNLAHSVQRFNGQGLNQVRQFWAAFWVPLPRAPEACAKSYQKPGGRRLRKRKEAPPKSAKTAMGDVKAPNIPGASSPFLPDIRIFREKPPNSPGWKRIRLRKER